jgi:hypothetical protein
LLQVFSQFIKARSMERRFTERRFTERRFTERRFTERTFHCIKLLLGEVKLAQSPSEVVQKHAFTLFGTSPWTNSDEVGYLLDVFNHDLNGFAAAFIQHF